MFKKPKKPTFTSADIEAQLSQVRVSSRQVFFPRCLTVPLQITLDEANITAENLEPLAPLVKTLQDTQTSQLYLRSLDTFVQEKEHEIERICNENYEDFASAVGMLLGLREGTGHLKSQIGLLDEQIGQVGQELSNKVCPIDFGRENIVDIMVDTSRRNVRC
jgi:hypothetical protein